MTEKLQSFGKREIVQALLSQTENFAVEPSSNDEEALQTLYFQAKIYLIDLVRQAVRDARRSQDNIFPASMHHSTKEAHYNETQLDSIFGGLILFSSREGVSRRVKNIAGLGLSVEKIKLADNQLKSQK